MTSARLGGGANGTVECWGGNTNGQTSVPAGLVATDLAAGTYWTCALPTTGGVKCWGDAVGVGAGSPTCAAPMTSAHRRRGQLAPEALHEGVERLLAQPFP